MPATRRKRSSKPYFYLLAKGNYYQVMLHSKYNSNRLEYFTGVRTLPEFWNAAEETDNGIMPKSKESALLEKMALAGITRDLQSIRVIKARLSGIKAMATQLLADPKNAPAPDKVKDLLNEKFNTSRVKVAEKRTTLYELAQMFIDGSITNKGKKKSPGTLKQYKNTLTRLKEFEKKHNYPINFDTITIAFYHRFVTFLRNEGNNDNTIGGRIKNLKSIMTEAVEQKLTTNMDFKSRNFAKPVNETDGVYLKESEIVKLYKHDFSDNKRLEHVRDLFVVGCFTGLRFSDYTNVQAENLVEDNGNLYIKIKTQKTKEFVIIPCNPIVMQVFDKYQQNENKLPRSISNQKFNEYIKEACKIAELTAKGRLDTDLKKPLHECVSSHAARRSFATNLYLEGYPTYNIMKITGHKTEKAFMKYIKVTKQDAAEQLGAHQSAKDWEKILAGVSLRVA